MKGDVFTIGSDKSRVNQWLGVAFVSLLCFWVVLYYFTAKAQIIGESYVSGYSEVR